MRTFRSLRHRNYRLYFFGQMVSLVGSWMQSTVLMWLAFELTRESKWPAFLMVAQIGPTFLLGAWAGSLADRYPRRPLILATQVAFLCSATLMTLLLYFGQVTIPLLLALMCVQGVIQAVDLPARLSFVPDLVAREDLINAVALNSLLFNVARAVGPAVAGVFLTRGTPEVCILINAVSYLAVLGALLAMTPVDEKLEPREPGDTHSTGFGVLRKQPRVLVLVIVAGLVAVAGWPLLTLLPAFAEHVLGVGKSGYSTLLSSLGVGALCAALTTATFGSEARRRFLILGGMAMVCLAILGLSLFRELVLASACCAVFGFGMILFFSTGQAMVQLSTLNHHRGKVMGVWAMMLSGGVPIGNLLVGPAADHWGVPTILVAQACAVGGVILLLVVRPVR